MKKEKISEAMGNISSRHIKEAAEFKAEEKPHRSKNAWMKWASLAACFCLIISLGIYFALKNPFAEPGDNDAQNPDIVYAQYINGYLYEQIFNPEPHYQKYPELKNVAESITTGYKFNLSEKDLGEYIGIAPALDKAHLPEGKAYHWLAYPNFDSIIIVEREGKYSLYLFSGEICLEDAQSSSSILEKYNLPENAVSMDNLNSEEIITDKSRISEICEILSNKQHDSEFAYRDRIWEAWQSEKGDVGVSYDGTDFSYSNAEIREEFAAYFGENIKTIIINTTNGFEITLRIDLRFSYFIINNKTFNLSQAETEQLENLLS